MSVVITGMCLSAITFKVVLLLISTYKHVVVVVKLKSRKQLFKLGGKNPHNKLTQQLCFSEVRCISL